MSGLLWEILDPLIKALRPPALPKVPAPSKAPPAPAPKPRPAIRKMRDSASEGVSAPLFPAADPPTITPVSPTLPPPAPPPPVAPPRPVVVVPPPRSAQAASSTAPAAPVTGDTMQAKYDAVVAHMLETHNVRVRKWRTSMSGIAWYVEYRDGTRKRLIEAPKPKGPMSIAVFLHEIGHHAIGFDVYKTRCLEEYHAWRWALEAMAQHDLNITDQVRLRVHRSLHYAVQKAKRRGIKKIPVELEPYLVKPPPRRRRD